MKKAMLVGLIVLLLLCLALIIGTIYGLLFHNGDSKKPDGQPVRAHTPSVQYEPTPSVHYESTTRVHSEPTTRVDAEPAPRFNNDPPASAEYPSFNYLGSLEYFTDNIEETEYRCTAIVLGPIQLLTTTKCGGQLPRENPKAVSLGSSDFGPPSFSTNIYIEIKQRTKKFENELMIVNLATPISETEFAANVSVATRCVDVDLNEETKLFAVGFAQNINLEKPTCKLFRQELHLISPEECHGVSAGNTHVCLKPGKSFPPADPKDNCVQCLTASASVLHIQRADGSICVAGLATPNTKICDTSEEPVSFTIIDRVIPNGQLN